MSIVLLNMLSCTGLEAALCDYVNLKGFPQKIRSLYKYKIIRRILNVWLWHMINK